MSSTLARTILLGYVPAPAGCRVTLNVFGGAPSLGPDDLALPTVCSADCLGDLDVLLRDGSLAAACVAAARTAVASALGTILRCRVKASQTSMRVLFFSTVNTADALRSSPTAKKQLQCVCAHSKFRIMLDPLIRSLYWGLLLIVRKLYKTNAFYVWIATISNTPSPLASATCSLFLASGCRSRNARLAASIWLFSHGSGMSLV